MRLGRDCAEDGMDKRNIVRSPWLQALLCLLPACTALEPGGELIRQVEQPPAMTTPDAEAEGLADAGSHDARVDQELDASRPCNPRDRRETRLLDHLELTADTTLGCEFDWEIEGYLLITSGTLRVDAGVTVRARPGAFVLVGRDARIEVAGTAAEPVVFTAAERPSEPGAWRGLFLLGLADTALPNNATLALTPGDVRGLYGGDDDEHDCGSLSYTRIEFAGGAANDYDFPAAGLTLAGCGRATRVSHVQVHAATDGIGLIGGTAPLKRVLVSAPRADGIEWAAGYRGFIQFALVQTFVGSGAALKGSRSDADQVTPPASAPVLFNATLVGAMTRGLPTEPSDPNGFETGVLLQAATQVTLRNSLVYGFAGPWLDVVGDATAQLMGKETQVTSTIFADPGERARPGLPSAGVEPGDGEDDDGGHDEHTTLHQPGLYNRFPATGLVLRAPFAAPPYRPDFSADGFVDGGKLSDSAPEGWQAHWEPAFYAGALPKLPDPARRELDWTVAGAPWTDFPEE
jgi:hypothetical protein